MSIAEDIRAQIKQNIRDQIAKNVPKEKTFGGFLSNLKTDITGFGKGLLGVGRYAATKVLPGTIQSLIPQKPTISEETGKLTTPVPTKEKAEKKIETLGDVAKTVGTLGKETVKAVPKLGKEMGKIVTSPIETTKQLIQNVFLPFG